MSVKKSDVVRAVVVRTVKTLCRESGMFIRFDQNAVVIVNADGSPKGSLCFNKTFYFMLFLISLFFLFAENFDFILQGFWSYCPRIEG